MKMSAASVAAFVVMGAAFAFADAHGDRQAVMRSNGGAVKAINGIVIGIMDPVALKAQAQILVDNGAKIASLFAPGTDQNDPAAQPLIWTDAAGFKAADDKFVADVTKVIHLVPDRVALAIAMKDVQADCGACHQTYRVMPPPDPAAAGRGGRGVPPPDQ
jgi:cytochrome c556